MPVHDPLTTTVSTNGQIVLPRPIRQTRQWRPGTKLTVENTPEGVLLKAAPVLEETSIAEVFGMLSWVAKSKSLEEMEAGILAEAARQHEGD